MAKKVKPISCPKCGSVNKTDLGEDRFRCNSCKTEYYLDDDYTHVVHHVKNYNNTQYSPPASISFEYWRKLLLVIGIFFVAISVISITLSKLTGNQKTSDSSNFSKSRVLDSKTFLCKNRKNEPMYLVVTEEGSYTGSNSNFKAYFISPVGKVLKDVSLNSIVDAEFKVHSLMPKYFSNGDAYALYKNNSLFKILPDQMEFRKMGDDFFNKPEFASGTAKIEDYYNADGFKLLTQDGKSFVFMPITQMVIPAAELHEIERSNPPQGKVKTFYDFATKDDLGQLVLYHQKFQTGYPWDKIYFDMPEDYEPDLGVQPRFGRANLLDYKVVSERIFFKPDVLAFNDQMVVAFLQTDAGDEAERKIQALDTKTGNVLWTYTPKPESNHGRVYIRECLISEKYVLLPTAREGYTLDAKTGKLLYKLKI